MGETSGRPAWFVLTRHWLSLLGVALLVTALISWLFVLPQQVRGHVENPYAGILVFLVLPAVFFGGLALVPIGVYLSKRQIRQGLTGEGFDRKTALRRIAWFFGVTTLMNIFIGTQVTYRAVEYMETPQFCGASCHTMKPELSAYRNSPHSRVECVECHVAPGAAGWIHAKTNGVRQLFETVLKTSPEANSFGSGQQSSRARERNLRELSLAAEIHRRASALIQQVCRRRSEYANGDRSPYASGWKPALRNSRRALGSGSSHPLCGRGPSAADDSVGRIQKYRYRGSPSFRHFRYAAGCGQSASTI